MALKSLIIDISDDTDSYIISDILLELGALSVTTTDVNRNTLLETPILEETPQPNTIPPQSNPRPTWPYSRVTALFPMSTECEDLIMSLATHFNLAQTPTLRIHSDLFEDKTAEEWLIESQKSLQPILLDKVAVIFPWHAAIPNVQNVMLGPGLAFGTGEHATTKLCARWLQKVVQPGNQVLDFGTGSGLLAIIAAKMEVGVKAVGVDLDEEAVRAARENVKRNGVEEGVQFYENREEPKGRVYDVVVANILAGVLKKLAEGLVGRMKKGGWIGLSGILVGQVEEVRERYRQWGIDIEEAIVEKEWVLLVGRKRGEKGTFIFGE